MHVVYTSCKRKSECLFILNGSPNIISYTYMSYNCAENTCYSFPTKCLLHLLSLCYIVYTYYTLYSLYSIRYALFTTMYHLRRRFVSTSYCMDCI